MTLIQTFELAQDFSPIYVITDICNSFQDITTHKHISTEWIKCVHDNCMTI